MRRPSAPASSSRRSHALRDALALVGGLAFGVIGAVGIGWIRDQNQTETIMYSPDERVVTIGAASDVGPGAATPLEAIDQFLTAEVDDDAEGSLAILSPSDRQSILTINSWERTRRIRIGRLVGHSPIDIDTSGSSGTAIATTTLELAPSLDPINGLIAPSADAELHLVDDDGWRVDLGSSVITPDYLHSLDAAGAETAANEWLANASACEPLDAAGDRATFRGSSPALTDQLCSLAGAEVIVGPSTELSSADAASGLTASYGSSVRDWAAVVPVYEPTAANLVLAPVGDRWIVIDVLSR